MERIQAAIQKAKEQRDATRAPPAPERPEAAAGDPTIWGRLPILHLDVARIENARVVTLQQTDPSCVAFDMMRTRLMRTIKQKGWISVGITSPMFKCGKSLVSINLALAIARQKEHRVVLVDLDLHQSGMAKIVGKSDRASIDKYLRGEMPADATFQRFGNNLAVATNTRKVPNSSELLQSQTAIAAICNLKLAFDPDIVIYDLPPLLLTDDVLAFVPNVDCVLVVAAAYQSTANEVEASIRQLAEQTNVLGVILNKCEQAGGEIGYGSY